VKLLGNGDDAQSGTNSIRFLGVLNLGGTNLSLFPNCARVGVRVVLLENTSTFWAFLFLRGPNSITAAIAYGIPVKYAAPAINPHKIRYRREFGVPDISLRECGFFPETRAELLRYPAPSEVSEPEGRGELSYGIFQWRHNGHVYPKMRLASRGKSGSGANCSDIQILGCNSRTPIRRRIVLSPQRLEPRRQLRLARRVES